MKQARLEAGWSQMQLVGRIKAVGAEAGENLPNAESIKASLSRWENGRRYPSDCYRKILRQIFGKDDVELGLVSNDQVLDIPAAEALAAQLDLYEAKFDSLVANLRAATESIRARDRDFGACSLLDSTRVHVEQIAEHLVNSVGERQRVELARLLADALAGWQALDLLSLVASWRLYATANGAARTARDAALDAFTTIEQAQVLVLLGRQRRAAYVAGEVLAAVRGRVAKPVECWVSAGAAELMALAGEYEHGLALLSQAEKLGPSLDSPLPPYLVFDRASLDRWIGHTQVILQQDDAVERLESARSKLAGPPTGRAGASLEIDLAAAYRRAKDDVAFSEHLECAERLAMAVGSQRCLMRIKALKGVPA
ncbi:helix-turn-helix domain-containing protein [Mumia sp. Pv 4-285]|uniref:helix-turn-helix domain-containing protein n=1 Tax=Mumia qirimensis TaxID=3234852 RepID=UPI00351D249F